MLAQGLQGAIETLLDDATIHDRDRVFLRFHSPCYDNSFSQGLRVRWWRQEPDMVTAFLDDSSRKWRLQKQTTRLRFLGEFSSQQKVYCEHAQG